MGKIVVGYWDCPYCGNREIRGDMDQCPSCGRQRGDVTFYMKGVSEGESVRADQKPEMEYVNEDKAKYINKNPDWYCSYCNTLNKDNLERCSVCGSSREDSEGNYFTKVKEKMQPKAEPVQQTPPRKNRKGLLIALVLFLAVIIGFTVYNNQVISETCTVTDLSWIRTINVEKNIQYEESAWELPTGAELTGSRQEIHHFDSVLDHYEPVEVQRSRQVVDHYETYYRYTDLGNGHFEEEPYEKPVYTTEYYTETVQQPVYIQVPRYQTKYYYTIWRWTPDHDVTASGTDHETAWPEIDYTEDEREGKRTEQYRFTVSGNEKIKRNTFTLSESAWEGLNVGDQLHIAMKRNGTDSYLADSDGNRVVDIR